MLKKIILDMHNQYIEDEATKLGISKEEYIQKTKEESKLSSPVVYQTPTREEQEKKILDIIFLQKVDEFVKPTKTNINKIVKWTSSKFNDYRKKDVVDWVYRVSREPNENYLKLFECGAYSDASSRKNASNHGFHQHVAVRDGKIRFVYALDSEWQVVYEFE